MRWKCNHELKAQENFPHYYCALMCLRFCGYAEGELKNENQNKNDNPEGEAAGLKVTAGAGKRKT